jgi:hypothetical protein
LKRIFLILSVILLIAIGANAQQSRTPSPNPGLIVATYPNPATSYITFDMQKGYSRGLTLTVFNFLGKKMIETPNVTEKSTLNLSDFTRGVYVYVIDQGGKVVETGKFQVSR